MLTGWRGLGAFWLAILLLMAGGAVVLQTLGPLPPPSRAPKPAPPARVAAARPAPPPLVTRHVDAPPADRPGRDTPGPIADPDPALLEPGPGGASDMLPRIAEDGRRPMQVYAAGFDQSNRRPRIGILLAGIGLNRADSEKAIHDLPGPVTLAVSPYATQLAPLLAAARLADHEYLLSIPMEPQAFPQNDPGPRALMTSLSSTDNLDRLRWLMAHLQGYVGVTNALGGELRGERFAGMAKQMEPALAEIAHRGLLYVDARPADAGGQAVQNQVWSTDVDLVVDEPTGRHRREAGATGADGARQGRMRWAWLGEPSPVVVQHLAAWANGLLNRGLALAPVSALVRPPAEVAASGQ